MSKFKHHQEQIHIKDSDFNLATALKEKYFINNIETRKDSITELKKLFYKKYKSAVNLK